MSYDDYEGDWELEWAHARSLQAKYGDSAIGTRSMPPVKWDSPAEVAFASIAIKYLASDVSFSPGRQFRTQIGQFRPDIVLARDGRVLGLEIDGREFHKDVLKDRLRESLLLAGRFIHVIYRFAASTTWYRAEDCVYALSKYERSFFDRRAIECVLPRLVSKRVLEIEEWPAIGVDVYGMEGTVSEFDGDEDSALQPMHFNVFRRTLDDPLIARTNVWVRRVVDSHGPISFETLLEKYRDAVRKAS